MAASWIHAALLLTCLGYAITQDTPATPAAADTNTGGACQSEYTEQPPNELQCDPYQRSVLTLECTILIPNSHLNIEVVWFRSHLQTSEAVSDQELDLWLVNRLVNTQPNVLIREQRLTSDNGQNLRIRSQLRVTNLNDTFVGDYWCRIKVDNTQWLIPSDSVYLQQSNAYSHFGACSEQFAQSKQERKCASWDTTSNMIITSPRTMPTSTTPSSAGTTGTLSVQTESSWTNDTESPTVTENAVTTIILGQNDSNTTIEAGITDKGDVHSDKPLLNELYISISILVLFGVIILILVPVMMCMCVKRKTKGRNCPKPDLERVQPSDRDRRSLTMPVASDYLVPIPFLGITREQLEQETQRMHRSRSLQQHSYETTLSASHEYEDVKDFIDSDKQKQHKDNQPTMKRNAAYRACSTSEDTRGMTRIQLLEGVSCRDVVIPNPLNCIYTRSQSGGERLSDASDDSLMADSTQL